jgi:hypothetical protein
VFAGLAGGNGWGGGVAVGGAGPEWGALAFCWCWHSLPETQWEIRWRPSGWLTAALLALFALCVATFW